MAPKLNRMPHDDPLIADVVEADGRRAVARQSPAAQLGNHAGLRHAGALFALGHAACGALVASALGRDADSARAEMVEGEVSYEKLVGDEVVTATAEPSGEDWEPLLARVSEGEQVRLPISVKLRNEEGKTVTAMSVSWQVTPERGGSR